MDFKKTLVEIDRLLAQLLVSGDSVLLLAAARQRLKAAYNAAGEEDDAHGHE